MELIQSISSQTSLMAQYLKKSMRKPRNISLTFCFSWCSLNQMIMRTECILNYIGINIDISQAQSCAFSGKKVWFCFSQLLDNMLLRNKNLNERFSSRNTCIESWDKETPHQNDDEIRSEFPVKDIFQLVHGPFANVYKRKATSTTILW